VWGVAQVVECLPCKRKSLSSNPSPANNNNSNNNNNLKYAKGKPLTGIENAPRGSSKLSELKTALYIIHLSLYIKYYLFLFEIFNTV
jgi:hypothetical protein